MPGEGTREALILKCRLLKEKEQLDQWFKRNSHTLEEGFEEGDVRLELERRGRVYGAQEEVLADVTAALERIDNGTFGLCLDCGKEIPSGRLMSFPTAKRGCDCQAVHDREKKRRALARQRR